MDARNEGPLTHDGYTGAVRDGVGLGNAPGKSCLSATGNGHGVHAIESTEHSDGYGLGYDSFSGSRDACGKAVDPHVFLNVVLERKTP